MMLTRSKIEVVVFPVIAHPVSQFSGSLAWFPQSVSSNVVFMRFCNPTANAVDGAGNPFYVLLIR